LTKPTTEWTIKGELFLNCSCEVFCPCVVSLGKNQPSEGHCFAWMAVRIDSGNYGGAELSGINIGLFVEIPGRMGEGGWKVGVYVDDRASDDAYEGILQIFSGKAGGTTGLLGMLTSEILGVERTPVAIETDGNTRRIVVGKKIQGEIEAIIGGDNETPVMIKNTKYWMGPDITVAKGTRSRVRAFGRVWDFDGKSGEMCAIDWHGPNR
jgi:hypothetical protein